MFPHEYTIVLVLFGIIYYYGQKNSHLISLFLETLLENTFSKGKIVLEEIDVNGKHLIKYGNFLFDTFKINHYYDIKCFESIPSLNDDKENYLHLIKEDSEYKSVNMNLETYRDYIMYLPFRPKDRNCKKLYICIKRIQFQEYAIYRYDENEYIDIQEVMNKYETWLHTPQEETELAEAYD